MSAAKRVIPSSATVSRFMSRLPRQNTGPELALRRALHARGIRFRLHPPLPGRPDIVLMRSRVAIFVDGCFWHGCPTHAVTPKANRRFWIQKIATNKERDTRKDHALRSMGWTPVHVWEHEDMNLAARRLEQFWKNSNS